MHEVFIFPNIEMRLGMGTVKGKWVNLHLLVSPEDPNHLIELKRFLAHLTFSAYDDSFCCNKEDLIRLGQRCDSKLTTPIAALEHGSEQFKVSFDQLKQAYKTIAWAQQNILIAVAGGETDGTSGVRDAADATLRQEIEKFAHVIFASSLAQREFWLGRRSLTEEAVRQRYGGLKPCMHGSDAHEQRTVGIPDGDRYSWIKGSIAFDTLRQVCIDPAGRAFVGDVPPVRTIPSQTIEKIEIRNAPWAVTSGMELAQAHYRPEETDTVDGDRQRLTRAWNEEAKSVLPPETVSSDEIDETALDTHPRIERAFQRWMKSGAFVKKNLS